MIVHFNKDIDFSEVLMKNYNFFKENNIRIKNVEKNLEEHKIEYTLIMGKQIDILDMMSELSTCNHISHVLISLRFILINFFYFDYNVIINY